MTEISDQTSQLPPAVRRFVLHWGEMGTVWGVNRSVGQIHALLYLSDQPMTAEDIAGALALARSNVSTSLKELQAWGLIRRVHVMGDRRDFFAAETDMWEMVTRIAEGRKARELDPTLATLKTCLAEAEGDRFMSRTARERILAMHDFVSLLDRWSGEIRRVPRSKLTGLLKLGAAIARFLPGKPKAADAAGPESAPAAEIQGETSPGHDRPLSPPGRGAG